ncbi:MAG: hypothetical protein L6Q26_12715 [Anaerolineales bacterium]|nr:hypothetical protein [Anaerolineales bacterium]NUQ85933.1 hypothetical protein [Anaerolineales bacterium]
MTSVDVVNLNLTIAISDGTEEELDIATRRLLMELKDFDVESVELIPGSHPPSGAKAVDPITAGAIALAVLPAALPKILEFLQVWSLNGRGRTIKFKGRIASQNIEFEGSFDEMEKLVGMLEKKQKKTKK